MIRSLNETIKSIQSIYIKQLNLCQNKTIKQCQTTQENTPQVN